MFMTIVFSRNSLDFSPKTSTFFRMELGSLMFKQEEDVIPVSMCLTTAWVKSIHAIGQCHVCYRTIKNTYLMLLQKLQNENGSEILCF